MCKVLLRFEELGGKPVSLMISVGLGGDGDEFIWLGVKGEFVCSRAPPRGVVCFMMSCSDDSAIGRHQKGTG